MNRKVHELINEQINKEFYSAYLYLEFANYFGDRGLDGFRNWYMIQAQEERDHALLFLEYLGKENESVTLLPIPAPEKSFASDLEVLEAGLEHEKYVTSLINDIYTAASESHDYRVLKFLDWFIDEQGEEEENATDLITKYGLYARDAQGLYLLNQELAARVYTAPSLVI